jgi:uncharacterized protein
MLIILKATEQCNLACDYCSFQASPEGGTITAAMAEALAEQLPRILSEGEAVEILWHGGEPTTIPIRLFSDIQSNFCAQLKETGHPVRTLMQTNAFAVSSQWRECLLHFDVSVGVSLDGPAFLHDAFRKTAQGIPSYDAILRNIRKMADAGIPVALLCVVREDHAQYVREVGEWLKEMNMPVRFNPLTACGRSEDAVSEESYYRFLKDIFTFLCESKSDIPVEPLEGMLKGLLFDRAATECSFSGKCGHSILSLFPDGGIGPCGRIDWCFGNILHTPLTEMMHNEKRIRLTERGNRLEDMCGDCNIRPRCNGGCPAINGDVPKPEYCSERKKFFEWLSVHGMDSIKEELLRTKKELKDEMNALKCARDEFTRLSDV